MNNLIGMIFVAVPFLLISFIALLAVASLAFSVWMFIDCLNRDSSEFPDKTLWTVLLAIGFIAQYNFLLSIIYYFVVKKKLDN